MHFPKAKPRRLHDPDDDQLLETLANLMAHVDPRSATGAPVLVSALQPHLARHFPEIADVVAALLRLERSERLTLIRRDPAFPAVDTDAVTCVRDGLVEFIGVALR